LPDLFMEYEKDVLRTANMELSEKEAIVEAALGLTNEAGEAAGVVKKWATQGHDLRREDVVEEAGDTLYYLVRLLNKVGSSLPEAMIANMLKRCKRYPDGFDPERSRNRG
jgi:NTP pyrophosphatase (non-canonical NTP hydrolase)